MLVTVPAFPDVRSIVTGGTAAPAGSADHREGRRARGRSRAVRARHPGGDVAGVRGGDRNDPAGADVLQRAGARRPARRKRDPARAVRLRRATSRHSGLAMMSQIGEIARQLDFTWVGVPADSPFDGQDPGRAPDSHHDRRVGRRHHPRRFARGESGWRGAPREGRPRRGARDARSDRALRGSTPASRPGGRLGEGFPTPSAPAHPARGPWRDLAGRRRSPPAVRAATERRARRAVPGVPR